MSRFADIAALERVPLGACQCPGTPHEDDFAMVRTQLGASAKARIGRAELEGAVQMDPLAAHRQLVLECVASWNLVWPDPSVEPNGPNRKSVPVPINAGTVELLDDGLVPLAEAIDKLVSGGPSPNGSGGRSPGSLPAKRSRVRTKTQTPGT